MWKQRCSFPVYIIAMSATAGGAQPRCLCPPAHICPHVELGLQRRDYVQFGITSVRTSLHWLSRLPVLPVSDHGARGRQAGCCSWCLRAWAWSRCRSTWCRASWGARWPSSRRASTSSARAAWASAPPPSRRAPGDVAWHLRTLWRRWFTSGGCQDLHFLGLHCRRLPRDVALQHQAGSARHALATACIALVQARGLDQAVSPVVGQGA